MPRLFPGPVRATIWGLVLLAGGLAASPTRAQNAILQPGAAEPPKDEPKPLCLSPADEAKPALRYRFLPLSSQLVAGNAAPIYMRARFELNAESYGLIQQQPPAWLDQAFDKYPVEQARGLLDQFSSRLRFFEFGARRSYCDWNYTIPEQRDDVISMLLPDAQDMRTWGRFLNLKARVEISERKFDDAARTLETNFAFARHVGRSPFLIGNLIGIAIEGQTLARVEEFVVQPDAPNLYWALTTLPRPLVDMRDAMEVELLMGENMIPELAEIDRPHTPVGWAALLESMYGHMQSVAAKNFLGDETPAALKAMAKRSLDDVRKELRLKARVYTARRLKLSDEKARELPEDQTIAIYLAGHFRELRDDVYKSYYVPLAENRALADAADARVKEEKDGPFALFVELFPGIRNVQKATLRMERQVAALRVVEAIRLHMSRHGGRLPSSLAEIGEVPVPADPATGAPFEYRADGKGATLFAPLIENTPKSGIHYQITTRK